MTPKTTFTKHVSRLVLVPLLALLAVACGQKEETSSPSFTVNVTNTLGVERENIMVRISEDEIRQAVDDFNLKAFTVSLNGNEIASQYNGEDTDLSGIIVVLDKMKAGETLELEVSYDLSGERKKSYTKRTQAELSHKTGGEWKNREYVGGEFKNVQFLRVPPEHKDHSWFIRYEGPGWESDKVGYRFYLDQRNATDVFGKKTTDMVLQKAGQDGFDSYHEMQSWGMDVMKVGKSLGIGSIGYLDNGTVTRVEKTDSVTCAIKKDGDLYSEIETRYYGWQAGGTKAHLYSTLSIHAGVRQTRESIRLEGNMDRLCTGIVKDPKGRLKSSNGDSKAYGYLSTYGKQSLNNDDLGFAVFFPAESLIQLTEDKDSHVADLRAANGKVEWYFLAAWSGEPGGITSEEDFDRHVERVAQELASPVKVHVKGR